MDLDQIANRIAQNLDEVMVLYYRLIIVITNQDDGESMMFDEIGSQMNLPVVNVNLELSKRLLELTKRQRVLQANRLMNQVVSNAERDIVLLDNIQLLFEPSLRQNPLHLLQGLARNKTIVVAWPGEVDDEQLTYAEPGHPEYRQYQTRDVVLID